MDFVKRIWGLEKIDKPFHFTRAHSFKTCDFGCYYILTFLRMIKGAFFFYKHWINKHHQRTCSAANADYMNLYEFDKGKCSLYQDKDVTF